MPADSSTPDVSVVIVAKNGRDDVLAALASLSQSTGPSLEKIVVDDGSIDGTAAAVAAAHADVRVVAKPANEGLVAGRNTSLGLVRGRFVLMLDADTQVRPHTIATLVAHLEADPRVGIVGPRLVYPDGTLQWSCRRYPPLLLPFLRRGPFARVNPDPAAHRHHLMKDFDHATTRPVVWVAGAAQMWRAELPARIGPFDRRISSYGGEDLDWCLRAWRAHLEVHYVPAAEVVHVFQQVTRQRPFGRQSFRSLRDHYYLQLKHRGLRRDPLLREALA